MASATVRLFSRRLGLAIAEELLSLGAAKVLLSARGAEDLEAARSHIAKWLARERRSGEVFAFTADVSVAEGRSALVNHASELFGGALDAVSYTHLTLPTILLV